MFEHITIPKNSKTEISKLSRYMVKLVGNELGNINKACYKPKFVHYWRDMLYLTGFDMESIVDFSKSFPNTGAFKSKIFNDKYNLLILMCIVYFLRTKDYNNAKLFFYLLAIKNYSNIAHKHFSKFCSPELWRLAYDRLSNKHLYKVHNGIGNSIIYLSKVEFEKKKDELEKKRISDSDMYLFSIVQNLRHRLSQSFKAFATIYYTLANDEGMRAQSSGDEYEKETSDSDIITIIDNITVSMCAYKQIDPNNIYKAVKFSGLQREIATDVVDEFSKPKYREDIRLILIIMNKIVPLLDTCTERRRVQLIRKVNSNLKVGGYQIKDFIEQFLYKLEMDYSLKTIDKLQLIMFFCHYVTLYVRDRICK